jgi:cation transport regulator ChaC
MSPIERIAVFGYGSLVDPVSAVRTLGRPVGEPVPARLGGWKRRWSQKRDNLTCEKTFALRADGRTPTWVLGLNVEPADGSEEHGPLNGVLLEVTAEELDRLDLREIRYDRVDVTKLVELGPGGGEGFDRVITYTAKHDHYAPTAPDDAVILATYVNAVETAFAALGEGEREVYLQTTGPHPVEVVEAELVHDRIPAGNPRDW